MIRKVFSVILVLILLLADLLVVGMRWHDSFSSGGHIVTWFDGEAPGGNSMSDWNDGDYFQSGAWKGCYNNSQTQCYLISWQWDGDPNNCQVTIPDEINGAQVVGLGGFAFGDADVFFILMPEAYQIDNSDDLAWSTESDAIAEEYPADYPVYAFTVTLNGAITSTNDCQTAVYYSTSDGQAIAYKVEMVIE